ncbi:unnamed protein product [Ceratitis capitata]|nr:unnamed protein product [Ceratitis capitata]
MRRIDQASDNLNNHSNHNFLEGGSSRPQNDHTLDINNNSGENRTNYLLPGNVLLASNAATNPTVSPRQRKKWTTEVNEYLLRTYLQITKLETHRTLFRKRLREKFIVKYPQMDVSEQNLSDQIRAIRRHDYITEARREQIKQEVEQELRSNSDLVVGSAEVPENTAVSRAENILSEENNNHNSDPTSESDDSIDVEKVYSRFHQNYAQYRGMPVTSLPQLPKLHNSAKLGKLVTHFDVAILPELINQEINLEEMVITIYCTAKTVTEIITNKCFDNLLQRRKQQSNQTARKNKSGGPIWLQRLDKNIEEYRRRIGKLTAFARGGASRRLRNQVSKICKNYNIHSRFETNEELPIRTLDTLKQKLRTLCTRREKYSLSMNRREHNRLFENNQKLFLRRLKSQNANTNAQSQTEQFSSEAFTAYWSSIWSQTQRHNPSASWISDMKDKYCNVPTPDFSPISSQQINSVTRKLHNWKSPGCDKIHAYWFKKLPCTHFKIAEMFTKIITGVEEIPEFLTLGTTYMIPKSSNSVEPSMYRPITCLPVIYKILTACISNIFYEHIEANNLIAEEQKGCIRSSQGCKEQLVIDQVVLGQAKKQSRNLYAAYIDWMKAFDSVPHSWLIEVLHLYKFNPNIIIFLEKIMKYWRTRIKLPQVGTAQYTDQIKISNGIFQGDSLSPLWFIISMNPLSHILRNTGYGYVVKHGQNGRCRLSHLFYVDDLKLYAAKPNNLGKLLECVATFSNDIKMPIGLDKCRKITIIKGKVMPRDNPVEPDGLDIKEMESNEAYKYLGVMQSNCVDTMQMRKKLVAEFRRRLTALCKTQLNGRNQTYAINSFVIPVVSYSFGIIKWSTTELENMQRIIRTVMSKYKAHHPKSSVFRTTLARKDGGRGQIDIGALHDKLILNLRTYFHVKSSQSEIHQAVESADDNYTPLRMNQHYESRNTISTDEKLQRWSEMAVHGAYRKDLLSPFVDQKLSHLWLTNRAIFAETEGTIFAMQDGVVPTRNYVKYVIRDINAPADKCRRCNSRSETLDHVLAGCTALANSMYLKRHNDIAKIIHMQLAQKYKFHQNKIPYYRYIPESVHEDTSILIYYDRTVLTNATRDHNRPDIFVVDKASKVAFIIDIAVPLNKNMQKTYTEKIAKYSDLGIDAKRQWKLRKVYLLPIIVSAHGLVHINLKENLRKLQLSDNIIFDIQKAALLNSCHIIRNFLQ